MSHIFTFVITLRTYSLHSILLAFTTVRGGGNGKLISHTLPAITACTERTLAALWYSNTSPGNTWPTPGSNHTNSPWKKKWNDKERWKESKISIDWNKLKEWLAEVWLFFNRMILVIRRYYFLQESLSHLRDVIIITFETINLNKYILIHPIKRISGQQNSNDIRKKKSNNPIQGISSRKK